MDTLPMNVETFMDEFMNEEVVADVETEPLPNSVPGVQVCKNDILGLLMFAYFKIVSICLGTALKPCFFFPCIKLCHVHVPCQFVLSGTSSTPAACFQKCRR